MPVLPDIVSRTVKQIRASGEVSYTSWVWFHASVAAERAEVDTYLVAIQHPLAFQAGTPETRFRKLVDEVRFMGEPKPHGLEESQP